MQYYKKRVTSMARRKTTNVQSFMIFILDIWGCALKKKRDKINL